MKLIKKLLKKIKVEKKEKKAKKAKKALYVFGLCCAFCAGAALTGFVVFRNREKLAVMTVGKRNIKRRKLLKILKKAAA